MRVIIERTGEEKTLRFSGSVKSLLDRLGINPEEVIVAREGRLLTLRDRARDKDTVRILPVISGG